MAQEFFGKFERLHSEIHRLDLAGMRQLVDLLLLRMVRGRPWRIVDIGSYVGQSSLTFYRRGRFQTQKTGEVYAIDTWKGCATDGSLSLYEQYGSDAIYQTFCNNVRRRLFHGIIPVRDDAVHAGEWFPGPNTDFMVDMVFIDANYTYDWYLKCIQNWVGRIRKGGFLCGRGYGHYDGVSRAVDQFGKDHAVGQTLWFRRV